MFIIPEGKSIYVRCSHSAHLTMGNLSSFYMTSIRHYYSTPYICSKQWAQSFLSLSYGRGRTEHCYQMNDSILVWIRTAQQSLKTHIHSSQPLPSVVCTPEYFLTRQEYISNFELVTLSQYLAGLTAHLPLPGHCMDTRLKAPTRCTLQF